MRMRLEDICERGSSNLKQSDIVISSGKYPIYGASGHIGNVDFYHQDKPYVAVVKDGAGIGRTTLHPAKSSVIGTMQYLIPKKNVLPEYLYYVVRYMHLEKYFTGATIPHIYFKDYKNEQFNLDSLEKQEKIIGILGKCESLINAREKELKKLDKLIRARFVEMFGDTIINSRGLNTLPMSEICEIIDGDRGKNYPTADEFYDEGYCLFLNAKNVTSKGFCFDDCMFISKEKNKLLRNGKLNRGDIVLTTRGTLGNLAFYGDNISFENIRINSGMVILRMRNNIMNEIYFIEQFKMKLDYIKKQVASGSAQPQLPISTIKKIHILIPDIEKQREFAEFVQKVNKSKLLVVSPPQIHIYKTLTLL